MCLSIAGICVVITLSNCCEIYVRCNGIGQVNVGGLTTGLEGRPHASRLKECPRRLLDDRHTMNSTTNSAAKLAPTIAGTLFLMPLDLLGAVYGTKELLSKLESSCIHDQDAHATSELHHSSGGVLSIGT